MMRRGWRFYHPPCAPPAGSFRRPQATPGTVCNNCNSCPAVLWEAKRSAAALPASPMRSRSSGGVAVVTLKKGDRITGIKAVSGEEYKKYRKTKIPSAGTVYSEQLAMKDD